MKIITVQPDTMNFVWQVAVQLYNARKNSLSHLFQVIVFLPWNKRQLGFSSKWSFLEKKFPETSFFYYVGTPQLSAAIDTYNYIPLLRPFCLQKHWEKFPGLQNESIFYIDSDVVFTKPLDFLEDFRNTEVNYVSKATTRKIKAPSYIAASYFDCKIHDVLPEKLESYKKIDVLDTIASKIGISRQVCEINENRSGGAQYILKNIDKEFWRDVFDSCIYIREYLQQINKKYFESEEKGFQSWCADIWATLWNIWKRDRVTEAPPEMDFCWSTDPIEDWDKNYIYHDAGGSPDPVEKNGKFYRVFYKKGNRLAENVYDYCQSYDSPLLKTPFNDDLSYVSPELCSYNYVREILSTKKYLNL